MASQDHHTISTEGIHFDSEEKFRYELAKTVTLTPELYERLFISPKTHVAGDLRSRFGNPTPVGVLGFSVGIIPLAVSFMGWQGAGGSSVATTTVNIWFGGMLLILAGIGEFLLGNTFPMMVFLAYGAHFLSFSTTFIPYYNAIGYFNPDGSGIGSPGAANQTAMFSASYAWYPLAMCILSCIFLVGSLRTNVVFIFIFIFAAIGFGLGTGAYFHIARGNIAVGTRLAAGLGACFFAGGVLGFYFLLALVVSIMELPIPDIPVGDMSTVIKARPRGVLKQE